MGDEAKKTEAGCAAVLMTVASLAASAGVGFLAGPGAGFLTLAALCLLRGLALVCGGRRGGGGAR